MRAPTGWERLTTFLRHAAQMHATDRGLRDLALGADSGASPDLGFSPIDRIRDRIEPLIRQILEQAHAEGSLRTDVTVEDVQLRLMMVSEVARHGHAVRPYAYQRYLQLLINGLRRSPETGELGIPLNPAEADAIARQWPAQRPAAPGGRTSVIGRRTGAPRLLPRCRRSSSARRWCRAGSRVRRGRSTR
ncbi:hypothetical protein ACFPIJ_16715 [Dactylosporangium cerinum]|uniref:Transcriptional regulator SbtR-like C-terminal domain-containing protein n=1 Tax=Dactylosporangium cerinum TaxID=1434730 RepID=A0ABV9VVW8_9ACTN